MARTRSRTRGLVIRDAGAAAALVSPVRQEIVDAVASGGAGTIAEIGAAIGRRADALYFHVRALVDAGILVEVGRKRAGRRFGAVYDVAGRPVTLGYEDGDGAGGLGAGAVAPVVRAALRLGEKDFRRALESGSAVTRGEGRNTWGGRVKGWLDAGDLREVDELMGRLMEVMRRGRTREGANVYGFAFAIAPAGAAVTGRDGGAGGSKTGGRTKASRGGVRGKKKAAGAGTGKGGKGRGAGGRA